MQFEMRQCCSGLTEGENIENGKGRSSRKVFTLLILNCRLPDVMLIFQEFVTVNVTVTV